MKKGTTTAYATDTEETNDIKRQTRRTTDNEHTKRRTQHTMITIHDEHTTENDPTLLPQTQILRHNNQTALMMKVMKNKRTKAS